jgi:hypothetical protein
MDVVEEYKKGKRKGVETGAFIWGGGGGGGGRKRNSVRSVPRTFG